MGLLPRQAARINPAEADALLAGDQQRFNRDAQLLAWFVSVTPLLVSAGVDDGIRRAFGEKSHLELIPLADLLRVIPGYEEIEE